MPGAPFSILSTVAVEAELFELDMNAVKVLAICGLATLLFAGCMPVPIPGKIATSPEVYGRVVDSKNGQPVQGATVTFKDFNGKRRSSG